MPRTKKDFEPARLGVFATIDLLLTQLNCGIQVELTLEQRNNMEKRIPRPAKKISFINDLVRNTFKSGGQIL
jgi:hypothetical protein